MNRYKKYLKRLLILFASLVLLIIAFLIYNYRPYSSGNPPAIPKGRGYDKVRSCKGSPANPRPISINGSPYHPYLACTNSATMHVDAYASGAHPRGGPLGIHPNVISYAHGAFGGECACVAFDSKGNIVAVFGSFNEFALLLLSPYNLKTLAKISLPGRKSNRSLNIRRIMNDTSGGAYFFLDNKDRAVLVDANQDLKIIAQVRQNDHVQFEIVQKYALADLLERYNGPDDAITAVLPDWENRYWFVSRLGMIGVFNPNTGNTAAICLDKEEIQNSFVIDRYGAYIVSDHAMYGIRIDSVTDQPSIAWRETYERASLRKTGSLTPGSGTTPTLLGEKYVAIADNADPRIHILVYRREMDFSGNRLICKAPVFEAGKSTTDNSLIGVGNSLIVENNYGYDLFTNMQCGRTGAGGVARVDFSEETGKAEVVWCNPIISQTTVPKVSLQNGLVYVYAKDPSAGRGIDAYYLSAIDFETGETQFEILTGTGVSYDNNWAPITLGPDNSAYIGVLRGLVKVFDRKLP
ncbi:MAG: hypothetical protein JW973_07530 [Bacteroidales bacterium]|nr:hypothetical protein [Bacteroidales bacterium]